MQPGDEATMTIGDIAGRFGLATHVLQPWKSVGLLTPARVVARRRRYAPPTRTASSATVAAAAATRLGLVASRLAARQRTSG
ncbi:MerR family transcriptional regulator [Micromonospora zamorensis]|uniref:MerR family transcriptional regulator n=1 Tax=Micromonospora zamorensis TaxID=709883 RepID=UPI0033CB94DE